MEDFYNTKMRGTPKNCWEDAIRDPNSYCEFMFGGENRRQRGIEAKIKGGGPKGAVKTFCCMGLVPMS